MKTFAQSLKNDLDLGVIFMFGIYILSSGPVAATSNSQEEMTDTVSISVMSASSSAYDLTDSAKETSTPPSRSATPPKMLRETPDYKTLLSTYRGDVYFVEKLFEGIKRLPVGIVFRGEKTIQDNFEVNLSTFYTKRCADLETFLENGSLKQFKNPHFNQTFYGHILIGFKTIADDLRVLCETRIETQKKSHKTWIDSKLKALRGMKNSTKEERERIYLAAQGTYNIFTKCDTLFSKDNIHLTAFLKEMWVHYQEARKEEPLDVEIYYEEPLNFLRHAPSNIKTAQETFKSKFERLFDMQLQHITFEEGHDASEILLPPEKSKWKRLKNSLKKAQ